MEFSQFIQLIVLVSGIIGVWINTQTKLKELEIRVIAIEKGIHNVENKDEKIFEKLDTIFAKLEKINIQLQNKQDRQ